jgi:hypothetical protein
MTERELKGRPVEISMSSSPAGQAGAHIGIQSVVRALIQFIALASSEQPETVVKLVREAALGGLNATKLDDLTPEHQDQVFAAARSTIASVLDVSLSAPAVRSDTH